MALYTRYVLRVDSATGDDTRGSGSSASVKDSDVISSDTLVITNAGGGSTVMKALGGAFAGPPIAGVDTLVVTDTVGGLGMFHIAVVGQTTVPGDTLTLIETPSTGTSIGNPWGIGGYFATIARAALLAKPTNTNAGADDHVYVKAAGGYSGTAKVTFSNAGCRSRPLVVEGYTTTPGDGGQTTYDITATAVVGFEPNGNDQTFRNFKLTNSGAVASWSGAKPIAGRQTFDNVWVTSSGTATNALNEVNGLIGLLWRGRLNASATAGIGSTASAVLKTFFSIVHDCGSIGLQTTIRAFCTIVDTCGTGTQGGAFSPSVQTEFTLFLCTAYNQGTSGDGFRISDSASNLFPVAVGNIFANNAGYGINRQALTASVPMALEQYNDFFGNGTAARFNGEDTTTYDAAPTDLALEPPFVDAANQQFAIGPSFKAGLTVGFPVGGTTYLDIGAVQRQEPPEPTSTGGPIGGPIRTQGWS